MSVKVGDIYDKKADYRIIDLPLLYFFFIAI